MRNILIALRNLVSSTDNQSGHNICAADKWLVSYGFRRVNCSVTVESIPNACLLQRGAGAYLLRPIPAYAIAQMLLCPIADAQDNAKVAPAPDIVVIGRKTRAPTVEIKPDDSLPASTIKGFGADSIGDVLARIRSRFGDVDFSILVNGHRVGGLDAIEALPPEALAKIDVLPASAAGQFGLAEGAKILDLRLLAKFDTLALEGLATTTTEGGGGTWSSTTRYAHIRDDDRSNFALTYRHAGGLLRSDRGDGKDESAADRLGADRNLTLVPRSEALTATLGQSGVLGQTSVDLSAEGGATWNVFSIGGSVLPTAGAGYYRQERRNTTQYLRAGAAFNGTLSRYSWTLSGNVAGSRSAIQNGGIDAAAKTDVDLHTATRNVGLSGDISGNIATLPAGAVNLALGFGAMKSWTQTTPSFFQPSRVAYSSSTATQSLRLPITKPGSLLGNLTAIVGSDYFYAAGIGKTVSYSYGADWRPIPAITLSVLHSSQPSLPAAASLYSPIIYNRDVALYDDKSGRTVPVTVVSGGSPLLQQSTASTDTVRANGSWRRLAFSASYSAARIERPTLSFSSPSASVEKLLPQLFVRTSAGVLTSYDSRPFSGVSKVSRTVSWNLHIFGMIRARSTAAGSNDAGGLNWDIGINHTVVLDDHIRLTGDSPIVDVISNPLNLSAATPSRHRIVLQGTVSGRQFGANAVGTWKSGYKGGQGGDGNRASRIAALALFNADFFYDFGRSDDASNPSRFRLKVSVDNLFNARPRFAGIGGTGSRAYGILSDPLGRVVALSMRKVF